MAGYAMTRPSNAEPPPEQAYGSVPVGDAVLDAAAACVERRGFDNTSLEEVASEAGVSRTTLYRRFGNREALFTALLYARAAPFREWAQRILMGPGSVAERLETVITHATLEMQRVGWLHQSLHEGISPASARLIRAAQTQSAGSGMGPLLDAMRHESGYGGDIDTTEVLGWIADQMMALATAREWEEEHLRERVRFFVIPALVPLSAGTSPFDSRLAALEHKIDRLLSR